MTTSTADLAPGTMTFAFGKHAYYLYWKRPDGRIGWGANLPSQQYLSVKQARADPGRDWLRELRATYADDTPGARLAAATTSETLQVVGALHIMPPVPHWYRDRMVLVGDSVHAPSNSTGQGASLAMESAIQLARCLRDLRDLPSGFAAYERLRRPRVEKVAARGAKISRAKTPGPIAARMMRLLLPVMMRTMNTEKTLGAEHATRSTGTHLWRTKPPHSHDVRHATSMMFIMLNARTKRADSKRESLDRILDAAARRLREKGLDGTAIVPVMREAGLTHGTFYSHFANKDDLASAAFGHRSAPVDRAGSNRCGANHGVHG